MATRISDEDLGIDAEEHPGHGRWRWIWTNDKGAQRFSLFSFDTDDQARRAARKWIKEQTDKVASMTRKSGG